VQVSELHDVALIDFPVARYQQMQQQHDAMMRELTLIALAPDPDDSVVPRRLISLAEEIFQGQGDAARPFRDGVSAAAERGDDITTLQLQIPYTTLRWMEDFMLLFDESDEYCRRGQLLTPPSPPEVVSFRHWLVGELIRQIRDGAPPSPFWAQGAN
jgi:hypothetical protein